MYIELLLMHKQCTFNVHFIIHDVCVGCIIFVVEILLSELCNCRYFERSLAQLKAGEYIHVFNVHDVLKINLIIQCVPIKRKPGLSVIFPKNENYIHGK